MITTTNQPRNEMGRLNTYAGGDLDLFTSSLIGDDDDLDDDDDVDSDDDLDEVDELDIDEVDETAAEPIIEDADLDDDLDLDDEEDEDEDDL